MPWTRAAAELRITWEALAGHAPAPVRCSAGAKGPIDSGRFCSPARCGCTAGRWLIRDAEARDDREPQPEAAHPGARGEDGRVLYDGPVADRQAAGGPGGLARRGADAVAAGSWGCRPAADERRDRPRADARGAGARRRYRAVPRRRANLTEQTAHVEHGPGACRPGRLGTSRLGRARRRTRGRVRPGRAARSLGRRRRHLPWRGWPTAGQLPARHLRRRSHR